MFFSIHEGNSSTAKAKQLVKIMRKIKGLALKNISFERIRSGNVKDEGFGTYTYI